MDKKYQIIITSVVLVIAVFSGVLIEWEFDKDFTTLKRDGDVLAKERWHVESERTYLSLATSSYSKNYYRKTVMCPRIVGEGGYVTPRGNECSDGTRVYYPDNYYEMLKRSLINTNIEVIENKVIKSVPNYAYGTSGAYAGYLVETMSFIETEKIEEFPENYVVDWSPRDTRNYKLVWRVEDVNDLNLPEGKYYDCEYQFGNLKINLKEECSKLDYAEVKDDRIWFYFEPERGQQVLDLGFFDPEEESECYQESANVTTVCGGLDTGNYTEDGLWQNFKNLTDGDWDTFGYGSVGGANLYINYTKPTGANESVWQIKDEVAIVNLTLNGSCWDYSSRFIYLKVNTNEPNTLSSWGCYNESGWHTLKTSASEFQIYEEGIYWTILTETTATPYVDNVTINSTLGTNRTSENLTVYWDASSDVTKNLTNWKLNGTSITMLNMPFENASGNMSGDYSNFENNATFDNATWNATGGYDGNGAFEFDGTGEFINIDNAEVDLENSTVGTWSMWIKPEDITPTQEIISFGDTDADTRIQFDVTSAGLLRALLGEAASTKWAVDTDSIVFSNATWSHVALVQNGTEPVLYVNGSAVAQAFSTSTDKTYWFGNLGGLDNGRIGAGNWNNGGDDTFFNGTIDDIVIYNHSLSADQIYALYINRTDLLSSDETSIGDNWSACITPFNSTHDGTEECSVGLEVLADDTCTCPSSPANWALTMSDSCTLNSECDITGYNITLSGSGTFTINNTLYLDSRIGFTSGMIWNRGNESRIFWGEK